MGGSDFDTGCAHPHSVPRDGGPVEAASYISGTVAELAQLSRRHGLDLLGYLLDMARLEADGFIEKQRKPGGF